jgi:uncharacterized protein (UPF0333 family)
MLRVPRPRRTLLGAAVTGVTAAGIATALVASQGGGTTAVLTAATLKQMADASTAAMTSGQADIDWSGSGSPSDVKQQVSFDGANWNDVLNPGQPIKITHQTKHSIAWTGESIERVVDGQNYHYGPVDVGTIQNPRFKYEWRHIAGAAGSLNIPDPRSLVSLLSPAAGFADDGTTTVNGITLKHLHATTPGEVALQPLNDVIQSEPDNAKASAIDLWVNPSGVVLRAQVTISGTGAATQRLTTAGVQAVVQYNKQHGTHIDPQSPAALAAMAESGNTSQAAFIKSLLQQPGMSTTTPGAPQSVTVTVTFSHIGQPQNITVPTDITRTPHLG